MEHSDNFGYACLRDRAIKFEFVSFDKTRKTPVPIFHILLSFWNILPENNGLSADHLINGCSVGDAKSRVSHIEQLV
jgi:hypothetical protein